MEARGKNGFSSQLCFPRRPARPRPSYSDTPSNVNLARCLQLLQTRSSATRRADTPRKRGERGRLFAFPSLAGLDGAEDGVGVEARWDQRICAQARHDSNLHGAQDWVDKTWKSTLTSTIR